MKTIKVKNMGGRCEGKEEIRKESEDKESRTRRKIKG
jgi:hypothetical protein